MYVHCPPKELQSITSKTLPDGRRTYVTPEGKIYPSVTTIIGKKDNQKKELVEWRERVGEVEAKRIGAAASSRGKKLHSLVERHLRNEKIIAMMENPDILEMYKSIKPLLQKINNIHYIEQGLWSDKLKVAGQVDLIAEWDSRLSVIDLKSSKRLKKDEDIVGYFAQCTLYALMYEERTGTPIDQLVILMSVDNEKPQVYVKSKSDYIDAVLEYFKYYYANLPKRVL